MKITPVEFREKATDSILENLETGFLYTPTSGMFAGTIYLCANTQEGKTLVNLSSGGRAYHSGGTTRFKRLPKGFRLELEQE